MPDPHPEGPRGRRLEAAADLPSAETAQRLAPPESLVRPGIRASRADALSAVVVLLAAVLPYLVALANGFAYDDLPLIPGDPRIREPGRWLEIFSRPYWPGAGEELGIYRPLTTLSFALDWLLSGGRPAWFHATSILWHAAACLLAFRLLRTFCPTASACAGALLFAVHPVHSEAVINIAARGELLAATCVLGACLAWTRDEGSRPRTRTVTRSATLYGLGLLAKESAVILPGLLLLLDAARGRWTIARGDLARYAARHGPAFATLALPLTAWLVLRLAVIGHATPTIVHPAAEHLATRGDLLRTALQAWPEYLRLLLFPRTLLADYGPRILLPATGWNGRATLGLAILLATATAGTLALALRRQRASLALLWFPTAVLPASNLLVRIGVLVAERTLYLPSLALSFGAAIACTAFTNTRPRPATRRAVAAALALTLVLLAARTVRRAPDWRSTETIFRALLRDRPDAYRAHWVLGRRARINDQPDLATLHYSHALSLWPYREALVLEAAAHAASRHRLRDANRLAAFAARTWPRSLPASQLLAAIALDLGDTATARSAAEAGLRMHPTDPLLRQIRSAIDTPRAAAGPASRP